jgi:flagellar motility protein MotE (MotC chaperone)
MVVYAATVVGLFMFKGNQIFQLPEKKTVIEEPGYVYWSFRTNEIYRLIDELRTARDVVRVKESELNEREARVKSTEQEMMRLRAEIESMRSELSKYLVEVESSELRNLRTEVSVLANLEPATVVTIFQEKTDDEVVKLMSMMKPDVIAPLMTQMIAIEKKADGTPSAERVARLLKRLERFKKVDAQTR